MKRVLSLVLALSMVMSMFTFAFAGTSLTDVVGTKYEAAVEALVELGIVSGYTDGTYLPEKAVTRAEMAKLLVIAAGLEPAAKVAVGATKFADVTADHWACGYINVAAEYGYIAGYPEGTFLPDETVSYAEAITMVLRVLGYKSVVEAKGTWPTNYIAKAQDLEMLDGVDYGTYTEGATRGNIAIIIWNMLKTEMWDITGESEGDGLVSTGIEKTMLEVKFPNYKYYDAEDEVLFAGFEVDDGKILVDIDDAGSVIDGYEYFKNDFYTFVYGQKVEALVNVKDETVLMMVPTGDEKLVSGSKMDLDEDYEALSGDTFTCAFGLVEKREIKEATELTVKSSYINKINTSNKSKVKFENDDALPYIDYDDAEDEIFLKDGERVSVKDIEVGDILSKVTVKYKGISGTEEFYIIGASDVEGKLTKFETEKDENSVSGDSYDVATIGGERYFVNPNAKYFEDPEDEDCEAKAFKVAEADSKMKYEVVEGKVDFFGTLTVVFFDGEIDAGADDDDATIKFVALTDDVDGQEIAVETEDGEDTLRFARKATANSHSNELLAGIFTVVSLDADGEIEEFVDFDNAGFKMRQDDSGDLKDSVGVFNGRTIKYGEGAEECYDVFADTEATFNDDTSAVEWDHESHKVNDSTVVVTLIFDDKGTTRTKDDEYRVEFSEGTDAIEKLKNDAAVVIVDHANKFARAKYVVIFDEVSNREDNLVGIVAAVTDDGLEGTRVAVADTRLESLSEIKEAKKDALLYKVGPRGEDHSGDLDDAQVVVYSAEENKDEEMEMTVEARLNDNELKLDYARHAYIAKGTSDNKNVSDDGREAAICVPQNPTRIGGVDINSGDVVDLDDEDIADDLEDYTVVVVEVEVDDADDNVYYATSVKTVDYSDVKLKELDRISIDDTAEVIFIIRGME